MTGGSYGRPSDNLIMIIEAYRNALGCKVLHDFFLQLKGLKGFKFRLNFEMPAGIPYMPYRPAVVPASQLSSWTWDLTRGSFTTL